MNRGLVIVGGGPAAHAAAEAFRARGGTGPVVLVLAEGRHPYNRPPLSKELLRGEAGEHELPLEAPGWYAERDVALRPGVAAALDLERRAVVLEDGDACPTTRACWPRAPRRSRRRSRARAKRASTSCAPPSNSLALRAAAEPGLEAVIVGSGFIGCEAAASLRARGCRVTLVSQEPAPQTERLGPAVAARLAGWLEEEGVTAHYGTDVERIDRRGGRLRVATAGPELTADLVLLASGVQARARLAAEAGLALADRGEIPVDAHMRTDAPGVLACGDCALAHNAAAGRPLHVEHWGDALGQGAVAGATAAGSRRGVGRGARLLVHDRRAHAQVRGVGRRVRHVRLDANGAGFTAWYARDGRCVGVLTHERDADYEGGRAPDRRGRAAAVSTLRAVVVVPARDEAARIAACLEALGAQEDVHPDEFAVIVVLDRCRDATGAVARAAGERTRLRPWRWSRAPRAGRRPRAAARHGARLRAARRRTGSSPARTPTRAPRRAGSPSSSPWSPPAPRRSAGWSSSIPPRPPRSTRRRSRGATGAPPPGSPPCAAPTPRPSIRTSPARRSAVTAARLPARWAGWSRVRPWRTRRSASAWRPPASPSRARGACACAPRRGPRAAPGAGSAATSSVGEWLARRRFDGAAYDAAALLERKGGTSVSVILPAKQLRRDDRRGAGHGGDAVRRGRPGRRGARRRRRLARRHGAVAARRAAPTSSPEHDLAARVRPRAGQGRRHVARAGRDARRRLVYLDADTAEPAPVASPRRARPAALRARARSSSRARSRGRC